MLFSYFSIALLVIAILGVVVSAELSFRYYKKNDPERLALGLMPIPDCKTVPSWVSWLNTLSWMIGILAIALMVYYWAGLSIYLAITLWIGYVALKACKIFTFKFYKKSVYASLSVPPDPNDMKTIPIWVTGLFGAAWVLIIIPLIALIYSLITRL
ncbi:MAG TPA: hypothetical protein VJP80_00185 [Candidatus Saccharimonadales bacterium]|nr:hypothetical protein [Candidatus Saccharimonadales bacterium]